MSIPQQVEDQKKIVEEHYGQQQDADTEVSTTTADTVAPEEQGTTAPVPQEDDYKQKYLSLQGKYNAEVPRLHQAVREQQARSQSLEQLLASMQQRASQPSPAEQYAEQVTADDREAYGDSIDVMRRVCQDEIRELRAQVTSLSQMVGQLTNSVVPRINDVSQRQARSDDSMFWSNLNAAVPNWREINDNQAFKNWLLEYDPLAGTTRQTLLEIAHKNLDVNRVASFFNTWMSMNEAPASQSTGTKRSVSSLEAQIAPGRGRGANPPVQQAPTITKEGVAKFYDDVRQGKFKGREAERSRLEHAIFMASKEGAIR